MLRIGVLGRLSLELDGRAISPPVGRPAQTVLGWLALNPGTHSRAMVAATLWPGVLDDSARGSLRVALVDLRRALGRAADQVLLATRDTIGLIDSPELEVDAHRFAELLSAGEADEAVQPWRGVPLTGLDAGDWLLLLRDKYRDDLSRAFAYLAKGAAASGDQERAMRLPRERVALDPFSEDATRDLMRELASGGDRAAALRAYEALAGRLRSELRTAPSTRPGSSRRRYERPTMRRCGRRPFPTRSPRLRRALPGPVLGARSSAGESNSASCSGGCRSIAGWR